MLSVVTTFQVLSANLNLQYLSKVLRFCSVFFT
uniref:Uncharacterized protein n=1 Tax=Siphoviridae sp. ctxMM9 TaxID=2827973 RepID=A0A8S5T6P3_9CAUD|nr:MAG TPA: hypothetical protein [Siphoviridae sp. ctxMM9]